MVESKILFKRGSSIHEAVAEDVCPALPLTAVREVMELLPYASANRVMFEMLFFTGCRISELDRFRISLFVGRDVYWSVGKNQKGHRHIKLPQFFIDELVQYRKSHRAYGDKLFGKDNRTFVRQFNKSVRPRLGPGWQVLRVTCRQSELAAREYLWQLKGLRKLFVTRIWKKWFDETGDASFALESASREMRHSSKGLTAFAYLRDAKDLTSNNLADPLCGQTVLASFDCRR